MPVILKRPRARIELGEIWEYIAEDSEGNANAFIGTIDRKLGFGVQWNGRSS